MDDYYDVGVAKITGNHPDGETEFIFEGLKNNVTAIKSMEDISICIVE